MEIFPLNNDIQAKRGMTSVLRIMLVLGLYCSATFLAGCSIIQKQSAADTAAATARTAYYTCGGCHGPRNVRVEFMTPNIIGQKQAYLVAKLRDFRDKKRIHPDMNGVTAGLTDQDISNLASYYAHYGKLKN